MTRTGDRVKDLHERRGFTIKVARDGDSVRIHITDEGVSRWLDLTIDEAGELWSELGLLL